MSLTVSEIADLLARRGSAQYGGEAVSQLEHALQCAHLAEEAGASAETVVAALLHDLGHLLKPRQEGDGFMMRDDLHQYVVLPFLRGLLPLAVLEPIRLHVDAKRYLCAVEPGYFESLSPASVRSLLLQGDFYSAEDAQAFIAQPWAAEAVDVRRWDDLAKQAGRATPALEHYLPMLAAVATRHALTLPAASGEAVTA